MGEVKNGDNVEKFFQSSFSIGFILWLDAGDVKK